MKTQFWLVVGVVSSTVAFWHYHGTKVPAQQNLQSERVPIEISDLMAYLPVRISKLKLKAVPDTVQSAELVLMNPDESVLDTILLQDIRDSVLGIDLVVRYEGLTIQDSKSLAIDVRVQGTKRTGVLHKRIVNPFQGHGVILFGAIDQSDSKINVPIVQVDLSQTNDKAKSKVTIPILKLVLR